MSPNNHPPTTLDEIRILKSKALADVRRQKKSLNDTTRKLFAPHAPATSKGDSITRAFHTGMAAFDGIMLGIKIIKKIRKTFRK